jgi:formylglycine-generating enzyme required for sulfatase activity
LSSKASIGLVKWIPDGHPRIGSRFHPREQPPREIHVAEFAIAHAPVTVSQYAAFINSDAVSQRNWWSEEGWNWLHKELEGWGRENRWQPDAWEIQRQRPYHPVVGITWYEAVAYCAWVSNEKKQVVRLPNEEEWEYAARGEDGRPFPWGENFDPALTNTLEGGRRDAVEVASLPGDVSPFGVMDMAGNVQEWTASQYTPLPDEVYAHPTLRVVRGGSFNDTVFGARTSYRRAYPPGYFYPFLGFRVAVGHRSRKPGDLSVSE